MKLTPHRLLAASIPLFASLSLCLSLGQAPAAAQSEAGELSVYERKYISFYPANYPELTAPLMQAFVRELPRFGYHSLDLPAGTTLDDFVAQVAAHQQAHAGELAAAQEVPSLRFGDKLVSWGETQRIMNAAFVMVPQWQFGELELKNLHKKNGRWLIDLSAPLTLGLSIQQIRDGAARPYASAYDQWSVSQSYPIDNMTSILESIQSASGGLADPENPLVQPLILEALKAMPFYQNLLALPPQEVLLQPAVERLQDANYDALMQNIKRLDAFLLKNQISDLQPERDWVRVTLSPGETASSLGQALDQGFKVMEYRLENDREQAVEVGYVKVRELDASQVGLQTILARRELELGDQLIEYPQLGYQIDILGGTAAIGLEGQEQDLFAPALGLRGAFSLAKALNISELYGLLSFGASLPLQRSADNTESFPGQSVNADAMALPLSLEIGLLKRWYLRQWMLELGAQGGVLGGVLLNSGLEETPVTFSPGLTLLAGTGWQFNPDFAVGLQGGWRFFVPGSWEGGEDNKVRANYPGLISNGPLLQLYANFVF